MLITTSKRTDWQTRSFLAHHSGAGVTPNAISHEIAAMTSYPQGESALTLEQAQDADFWRALCPGLSIGKTDATLAATASLFPTSQLVPFREEGYLLWRDALPHAPLCEMADAVERVWNQTKLPVFALVYDAFWQLPQTLSQGIEAVLGGSFRILPDSWVWRLAPETQDAGWAPHRDRDHGSVDPDGTPRIISLWVPLTDATPENGCIYVLPASLDPDYPRNNPKGHSTLQTLQHIRALPANVGTVLCWTHQLLHWGGKCSRYAPHPRVSVAFELQRADVPAYSTPLIHPLELPDFSMRLGLIGRQLLQYQHMVSLPPPLVSLAQSLHRHLPKSRSFASFLERLKPSRKTTETT